MYAHVIQATYRGMMRPRFVNTAGAAFFAFSLQGTSRKVREKKGAGKFLQF